MCAPSLSSNSKTTCRTKKSSGSQPAQHRVHLASGAAVLGWPRHKDERRAYACPKQSSSASSKKESVIVALQESVTKIS